MLLVVYPHSEIFLLALAKRSFISFDRFCRKQNFDFIISHIGQLCIHTLSHNPPGTISVNMPKKRRRWQEMPEGWVVCIHLDGCGGDSACLSVCVDKICFPSQSSQWDRKLEKLDRHTGRCTTPAVWQMSRGTNSEAWIFWTPAEPQIWFLGRVCF